MKRGNLNPAKPEKDKGLSMAPTADSGILGVTLRDLRKRGMTVVIRHDAKLVTVFSDNPVEELNGHQSEMEKTIKKLRSQLKQSNGKYLEAEKGRAELEQKLKVETKQKMRMKRDWQGYRAQVMGEERKKAQEQLKIELNNWVGMRKHIKLFLEDMGRLIGMEGKGDKDNPMASWKQLKEMMNKVKEALKNKGRMDQKEVMKLRETLEREGRAKRQELENGIKREEKRGREKDLQINKLQGNQSVLRGRINGFLERVIRISGMEGVTRYDLLAENGNQFLEEVGDKLGEIVDAARKANKKEFEVAQETIRKLKGVSKEFQNVLRGYLSNDQYRFNGNSENGSNSNSTVVSLRQPPSH